MSCDPGIIESNLKVVIEKFKSYKTGAEDIDSLLNSNYGRLLVCVKSLLKGKKHLTLVKDSINTKYFVKELDSIIEFL